MANINNQVQSFVYIYFAKLNNKFFEFWGLYYHIVLDFLSFVYSVSLWFTGNKLEGIFVGIWVPSILSASVALRQRRKDHLESKKKS